jgi:hypothetical protein
MAVIVPRGFCSPIDWKTTSTKTTSFVVVDAFVQALDLSAPGIDAANRAAGGRSANHPAALLKIYGYLNRIQSSRCLERDA